MIDKALSFLLALLFSLTGMVHSCHSANNMALHKPYTISPAPNYPLTAPPTDTKTLTDGKYTIGHFWTRISTVGWRDSNPVEILIDLGKATTIERISFNTARGSSAGVNYPAQITAFVGVEMDQLLYVGNLADHTDNAPGGYRTRKFVASDIGARGRYVLLEVVPSGHYLFCDEIEVLEGTRDKGMIGNLTSDEAHAFSTKIRQLSVDKALLKGLAREVWSVAGQGTPHKVHLSGTEHKIARLTSIEDSEAVEADVLGIRAQLLRNQFPGKDLLVENINPWTPLKPTVSPSNCPPKIISLVLPQVGYDFAALLVTNLSNYAQKLTVDLEALPHVAPVSCYHIPFVKSAAMEYVADPLVPAQGGFTLKSGESRMILLSTHGKKPGRSKGNLKIVSGTSVTTVPLDIQVTDFALPKEFVLNSVNWGYLDFKPVRNSKTDTVKDLFAHHTKVVVVPPRFIPLSNRFSPHDVVRLENYLVIHKGASKILFFLNFSNDKEVTAHAGHPFLSDEWKEWFKKLYSRLVMIAETAGFKENQLFLYPYDEVGGKDIDRLVALTSWAQKELPAIKFYATLNKKESLKALPYLDIAQMINSKDVLNQALKSKKELWLYGANDTSKSLSPYTYYRLMSWKAYYMGFTGVGFWNYADTGWGDDPGSAWDDFDGNRPDFAVIYEGDNGSIFSSRRWEAWRMGVEDYELLTMYAKSKGEISAKTLAKSVLDNPQDMGRADQVRQTILRDLSR
jgi:hypothetical protein